MHIFLGSLFYTGYLPKAPGTWASLACLVPINVLALYAGFWGLLGLLAVSCLVTFITTPEFERVHGKDPSPMVTDEVAGQSLTFLFIPFTGTSIDLLLLTIGFILFRLFDVYKPLGINKVQNLKGAGGVLLDDLIAGLYAYFCLNFIILLAL
ncbi:MAG: phosphatidylglycerophosphatase A [Balneolales bacterium]